MKTLRTLATSCSLLLAAILAHILAGGDSLTLQSATTLLLALMVISLFIGDTRKSPIRVVAAIFIAQNAGHFIAGGVVANENQMALSHIAAGFLSYQLLRYFDHSLPALTDVFLAYVRPRVSYSFIAPSSFEEHPLFTYRSLATPYFSLTASLRAPPSH